MKKALILTLALTSINAYAALPDVPRDIKGNIIYSQDAILKFKQNYPCPTTGTPKMGCNGYKPVPITPLLCGGKDSASNYEYLPSKEAIAELKRQNVWKPTLCQGANPFSVSE